MDSPITAAAGTAQEYCRLSFDLGEWLAQAAIAVLAEAGVPRSEVVAIGSHGQTIWHEAPHSTWQLGEAAVIAEFAELGPSRGYRCRWMNADEIVVRCQGVRADYLLGGDRMPSYKDRNVYYWYYATQVMHHLEGDRWKRWNGRMRDLLVKNQVPNGKQAGSWNPTTPEPDRWGYQGGRLYVTCMSVYILEVYYRHLPIYAAKPLGQ